ncbi:MAG: glycosyltransferase [Solirubrobacteraceae bacterium]
MKTPTVSVVIATHGRRDRLQETLVPLLADPAADEIVVVDDGSNDGTLMLLEDLAAAHPQLRPVPTRHRGRAAAGQLGLERATGEVVLLLDDDVVAAPGLVEGHARVHAVSDGLVVVGFMPIRLPACRRPGDASTFMYAGKAGLRGRFDRSLQAEHVHARNIPTLRREARGQGAGRVKIHRVRADVLPPFDGRRFACDLPAPLRRVVVACRRPRLGTFCAGGLAAAAKLAGRLRRWRLETNLVKLLRRVELQRGALDAAEHS